MRGAELGRDFLATRLHVAVTIGGSFVTYGNGTCLEERHLFHCADMIRFILTVGNTVFAIELFTCC